MQGSINRHGGLHGGLPIRFQLDAGRGEDVHNNLIRAQDIFGELRGALNMKAGTIATDLDTLGATATRALMLQQRRAA